MKKWIIFTYRTFSCWKCSRVAWLGMDAIVVKSIFFYSFKTNCTNLH